MQNGKKTALICGMAKSGIASAILLYKNGYKVIINDMKSEISGLQEALKDIEYVNAMGQEPETLLDGVDLLVLSPVIPIFKPFLIRYVAYFFINVVLPDPRNPVIKSIFTIFVLHFLFHSFYTFIHGLLITCQCRKRCKLGCPVNHCHSRMHI